MFQSNKYLGIPFVSRGDSFNGCDCIGLARLIYKQEKGIDLPKYNIEAENSRGVYRIFINEVGSWKRNEIPETFDIVAIANDPHHPKAVTHFGIIVDKYTMIHTLKDTASHIVMDIKEPMWSNKIKGFYKWQQ